jgi:cytochrome c oxidase subunit IV
MVGAAHLWLRCETNDYDIKAESQHQYKCQYYLNGWMNLMSAKETSEYYDEYLTLSAVLRSIRRWTCSLGWMMVVSSGQTLAGIMHIQWRSLTKMRLWERLNSRPANSTMRRIMTNEYRNLNSTKVMIFRILEWMYFVQKHKYISIMKKFEHKYFLWNCRFCYHFFVKCLFSLWLYKYSQ